MFFLGARWLRFLVAAILVIAAVSLVLVRGLPSVNNSYAVNPYPTDEIALPLRVGDRPPPLPGVTFAPYPTIITFWATWCAPCEVEMPILQRQFEDLAVRVIGVNTAETATHTDLQAWLAARGITFEIITDRDGAIARAYGAGRALPVTVFLDREGVIQFAWAGALPEWEIRRWTWWIAAR
ncbi:MAG TPA: TlpA disulfide reductase family protein [Aggregatilineales bacterium]|nr:TlpA family protein disulfide reductase [Anaerolineales bacterium]HRE46288.1 TlpA disulfide reductase family protein [Aggregatilineales bacterium]